MNMLECWIVFSKELKEAMRDRRSVMAGLLFALLGPIVLTAALHALIAAERNIGVKPVYVVGATRAPGLVNHLAAAGIVLVGSETPAARLLEQFPTAVVLAIPERAPRDLASGRSARIALWADMSKAEVRRHAERVQQLVSGYALQLAEQRLLGLGVALTAANPLSVDLRDTASSGGRAALVLGMLPIFWLLGVFVGGSHVALDSTGGERERRSLEVLLAQPIRPASLFIGKWLVTTLFGFTAAAAGLLLSAFALARLPLYELGMSFAPGAALLGQSIMVLLPLSLSVGALQCFMTLAARSHKEAQTYLTVLQLAPMVLVLNQTGEAAGAQVLPMLSQHVQLSALLSGQPVALTLQVAAMAVSVAAAGLLVWAGSRRLGSERFVFGL